MCTLYVFVCTHIHMYVMCFLCMCAYIVDIHTLNVFPGLCYVHSCSHVLLHVLCVPAGSDTQPYSPVPSPSPLPGLGLLLQLLLCCETLSLAGPHSVPLLSPPHPHAVGAPSTSPGQSATGGSPHSLPLRPEVTLNLHFCSSNLPPATPGGRPFLWKETLVPLTRSLPA